MRRFSPSDSNNLVFSYLMGSLGIVFKTPISPNRVVLNALYSAFRRTKQPKSLIVSDQKRSETIFNGSIYTRVPTYEGLYKNYLT